jgi:FkbM family methyltransferase
MQESDAKRQVARPDLKPGAEACRVLPSAAAQSFAEAAENSSDDAMPFNAAPQEGTSMNFSYAQHLEDYHLAQAFAGQACGFYIDIGAGHPVADNVSCWFYLQGWRGLIVEPQAVLVDLYAFVRPRDIAVGSLVGARQGLVDFHIVDRLHGFSTTRPEVALKVNSLGVQSKTQKLPITTLAALCDMHRVERIDFLKIDVEGAEFEVLRGANWQRWRPRIVLLEALAPGTLAESHYEWEPFLLHQGYTFVLFDGLNRFYVANEDHDLLQKFPKQPAPWLVVPHLGHTNRAIERSDHPDHLFCKALVARFLAHLPRLDASQLLAIIARDKTEEELALPPQTKDFLDLHARLFAGADAAPAIAAAPENTARTVRELYLQAFDRDAFRVLLGRIAASYDGGQILDE